MAELMEAIKHAQSDAPASEPSAWHGEDFNDLVTAKGWDGADDVLKGYAELEKFKGVASGEHIVMPKDAEDVEGWSKVFNAIGRPESADGYKFENQTDIALSDELVDGFKAFAHNAGYSQKQLEGAISFQLEAIKASDEIYAQQQAERKQGHVEAMQQKWQADFEPTVTKIDGVAEKLGVKAYFESLGIDKEPEIVNMLLTIANSDSEDPLNTDGDPPPPPATLQEQLKEITESDAFKQRFHPQHKEIMKTYMDLNQKIANAGQGQAPRT